MTRYEIKNEYFNWLCDLVCDEEYSDRKHSFSRLLEALHRTKFTYRLIRDANREEDGIDLRSSFEVSMNYQDSLPDIFFKPPCTVLEMMAALALRCEKNIMCDYDLGNRTPLWFWHMISNLHLDSMDDGHYNEEYVHERLSIFLNRKYARNGDGGLFTIEDSPVDLRDVEIWYQMCWYLNSIT